MVTYLALGISTVKYKKGKYIQPQIKVFRYNFPFTDYNIPCLLEKNYTCSLFVVFDKLKKILLSRIFVYVLFWRNWIFDQWKDYLRSGWGLLRCMTWATSAVPHFGVIGKKVFAMSPLVQCIYILALLDLSWKDGIVFHWFLWRRNFRQFR